MVCTLTVCFNHSSYMDEAMTKVMNKELAVGFFIYARKEIPMDQKCAGRVLWPVDAFIDGIGSLSSSSSLFSRDGVIALLKLCDDELWLHKVRSEPITFHLLHGFQKILTIRGDNRESQFEVTMHMFARIFLKGVCHETVTFRSGQRSVTVHQHFFATCMDSSEERQSKACRRFVSILRNWGREDNKHMIETVYGAYLYQPPVTKTQSFTDFIAMSKGMIDIAASLNKDNKDNKVKGFQFVTEGKTYTLEGLTYLSPIIRSVMEVCRYYQLDTSFYVFKDYVYCVPQFVVANCGIPLGIIVGRSETAGLYTCLLRGILQWDQALTKQTGTSLGIFEKFKKMPYLSDNHSSLASYGNGNNLTQYLCHRHIIERFGANSLIAICVRILLDCYSEEEFRVQLDITNKIIERRFERMKSLTGKVPQTFLEGITKYAEFSDQSITEDNGALTFRPIVRCKAEFSPIRKWALWIRNGVSSCSNHAEAFHRVLNELIRTKGGKPQFFAALIDVIHEIEKKQKQWKKYAEINLKSLFRKIKRCSGDQVHGPCKYCKFGAKIRDRYGVTSFFPCQHFTQERQKEMFDQFLAQVQAKLSSINITSDERILQRLVTMSVVRTSATSKEGEHPPPSDGENMKIDETGNKLLSTNDRLVEVITFNCYKQFKKKISFHWALVWIKKRLDAHFPDIITDIPAAYEYAIDELERITSKAQSQQ